MGSIVWAKGSQFVLSGIERHVEWNGVTTDYLQSWVVRIPAPGDPQPSPPRPSMAMATQPAEEKPSASKT